MVFLPLVNQKKKVIRSACTYALCTLRHVARAGERNGNGNSNTAPWCTSAYPYEIILARFFKGRATLNGEHFSRQRELPWKKLDRTEVLLFWAMWRPELLNIRNVAPHLGTWTISYLPSNLLHAIGK